MKEQIFNSKGTKQIIDTGWKEFDKQTNLIIYGNCLCNTQYSTYIRAWQHTNCNGYKFAEGELMNKDLEPYKKYNIPDNIYRHLVNRNRRESVILYMFFITDKQKRIAPFGWVITDILHNVITYKVTYKEGQSRLKRANALQEAMKYIAYDVR